MKTIIVALTLLCTSSISAQIWPAKTIPLHLAEPAVQSALDAYPSDKQARFAYIDGYCEAFLDAWRHSARLKNFHRNIGDTPRDKGYAAGVEERDPAKNKFSVSPSDFGYQLKNLRGVFDASFERSEFITEESEKRFHVCMGFVEGLPKGNIEIKAWVSPESILGYGHFGQWKQEIIVIEVLDSPANSN